ncbi:MAG TPA: ABC transporter ATP-binding protein, partial [Pseudomonadales bacterium]|nr:ABC transporter ATP-binding protein [Pseudomonadales bacterium]
VVSAGVLFGVFPFVFDQWLGADSILGLSPAMFFAILVAAFVFAFGAAWVKATGREGLWAWAGVLSVSLVVAAIFHAAVGDGGDVREFALIIGSAAFLITVAINPNGFVGSIREKRHEAAAKAARAALREGGVEVDDVTLPSLPVPPARHGTLEPGTAVLEVEDVTVQFGGLRAVDRASVVVPAGEIVGLIGPNGAGKTTLFDAIGGFNKPVSGSFRLLGRELDGLPPHARAVAGLGRTFQRTGLAMALTVKENLLLAKHSLLDYDTLSVLQRSPSVRRAEQDIDRRADEIIAALGFEKFADLPVKHLSGGQRRIVEIACTLATAPDLLMLDEPTAGMAPAAVENLAERLRELRDQHGRTILLIEHHVPLVLDVCDRVYVLDHGVVIAQGSPAEIMRDPAVLEAYLGERAARQAGVLLSNQDAPEPAGVPA